MGELFALGSVLLEGTPVRMAGQDTRRGTFVQRHAVLHDRENGQEWLPLANLAENQARFWIYDSLLSEYAALGFEYGYSVVAKDSLVVWEAQFGDFWNGASTIVDQFLVAAEDKWNQTSGLVMYLPHGFEGQGPEHSSGRVERFLTACAEDNIQVANVTQASQLFHLVRRQVRRSVRKPLVIMTPKSLLRAKPMRSPVTELTQGSFRETLDDATCPDRAAVRRLVLSSGKVGQEALAARDKSSAPVAIVRVEQLYPWPADQLDEIVAGYPNAKEIVWLQEEPENMGAWNFAKGRLYERFDATHQIKRVSRYESGSPASGSHAIHAQEQQQLIDVALSV
jgi:2-oxoglutarate dehydrogenase E1 component